LILAVMATAGIFLLDLFWLQPHVDSQKWAALRDEAVRAERAVKGALRCEAASLSSCTAAWAQSLAAAPADRREALERLLTAEMPTFLVDHVWPLDADGKPESHWALEQPTHDTPAAVRRSRADEPWQGQVLQCAAQPDADANNDMVRAEGQPGMLVARAKCGRWGSVVFARLLDGAVQERLSACAGGEVVLVSGETLPQSTLKDATAAHAVWLMREDHLGVAWLATDYAGQTMGYFRAMLPVTHIHRQATACRRSVLITMSLSVGLVLLIILGTHMLITGPVVRLLARLQRLDAGMGTHKGLTHDLHGEPLVLARRLESAFEKLAYMSKTDELTGLANRRHFEEVLEAFYYQARRYNRPLSLIVMDIDFFKAINDTGGHAAGDHVLKEFSVAVEDACRRADLPGRIGGDEFAILLPETHAADAEAVAERVQQSLAEHDVAIGKLQVHISSSMGIADLNAGEMDGPGAMMAMADHALYAAKQRGRNCIVQAHELQGGSRANNQSESGKVDVLSKKLAGLNTEFKDLFLKAIEVVMEILQQRDPHMADHSIKVQHYAALIAQEMELPQRVIKRLEIAAMLHDIGMLALNDAVLLCPSKLTEADHALMRRHPLLSVRIMERMEFLEQEIPAVRYHHERYDGKGYPEGIAGPAIPLTARILTVADAFDAMTSPRAFRAPRGVAEAVGEIRAGAGTQFDPAVVQAFMNIADRLGPKIIDVPGVGGHNEQDAAAAAAAATDPAKVQWRTGSLSSRLSAAMAETGQDAADATTAPDAEPPSA
jgi:diguanylate cyclase (GGDEF)-like protein